MKIMYTYVVSSSRGKDVLETLLMLLFLFIVAAIVIALYVVCSLSHVRALNALGYDKSWLAWIPYGVYFGCAEAVSGNEKEVKLFGLYSVPTPVFQLWWIVPLALLFLPFPTALEVLINLIINAVFLGSTYAKMYARLEEKTEADTMVIGCISGVIPIIAIVKFWSENKKCLYCMNCGAALQKGQTFCMACGTSVGTGNNQASKVYMKAKNTISQGVGTMNQMNTQNQTGAMKLIKDRPESIMITGLIGSVLMLISVWLPLIKGQVGGITKVTYSLWGICKEESGMLVIALVTAICAILSGIAGMAKKYLAAWIAGIIGVLPMVLVFCIAMSNQNAFVRYSFSIGIVIYILGMAAVIAAWVMNRKLKKRTSV